MIWHPVTFDAWTRGAEPNLDWGTAWELTREILRDRESHSFAALAGWAYIPSGAERAAWDLMSRGKYRPWTDRAQDIIRPPHQITLLSKRQREDREKLKRIFHIEDDL